MIRIASAVHNKSGLEPALVQGARREGGPTFRPGTYRAAAPQTAFACPCPIAPPEPIDRLYRKHRAISCRLPCRSEFLSNQHVTGITPRRWIFTDLHECFTLDHAKRYIHLSGYWSTT